MDNDSDVKPVTRKSIATRGRKTMISRMSFGATPGKGDFTSDNRDDIIAKFKFDN